MQPLNGPFHSSHHHNSSKKKGFTKLFLHRLANSNAYVAIPILAITVATYMTIGDFQLNADYVLFLFFSTLFLYPLHRLIGLILTLPLEYSSAQKAVKRKPWTARISVVIGFIGSLYFTFQISQHIFQILLPLGLLSITYSLPLIPTTNGWKRLRDIPGVKIYAISVVVTLTTSTIPLIIQEGLTVLDIALLGIQRFLFILAITIPFDIRDIRIDKKWHLKTIPLIAGTENALLISKALIILSSLLTLAQFGLTDILIWPVVIAILASNIWAIFIIEKFKLFNAILFNAYMMEGTMVFQFALITIAQILSTL